MRPLPNEAKVTPGAATRICALDYSSVHPAQAFIQHARRIELPDEEISALVRELGTKPDPCLPHQRRTDSQPLDIGVNVEIVDE
jgi:hypothetical protein